MGKDMSENIVNKVVQELKPTLQSVTALPLEEKHMVSPMPISEPPTYNPTPIAELKKRHIPIALYNPSRETKIPVKRKNEEQSKPWHMLLKTKTDDLVYHPTPVSGSRDIHVQEYVPTVKSELSASNPYTSETNSYDPSSKHKDLYYPKTKKRKEEYVPRRVKIPLNNVDNEANHMDYNYDEFFSLNQDLQSSGLYNPEAVFSDDEDDGAKEEIEHKEESDTEKIKESVAREKENQEVEKENSKEEGETKEAKSSESRGEKRKHSESEKKSNSKDKEKSESRESKRPHKDEKHDKHGQSSKSGEKSSKHSSSSSSSSSSKDKDLSKKEKSSKHSSHKHKKSDKDKEKKKESSSSSSDKHRHDKKEKSSESSRSKSKSKSSSLSEKKSRSSSKKDKSDSADPSDNFLTDSDIFLDLFDASDSDHDVEEECLKIFQVSIFKSQGINFSIMY